MNLEPTDMKYIEQIGNSTDPTPLGIVPLSFELLDITTGHFLDGNQAVEHAGLRAIGQALFKFEQDNPNFSQSCFDSEGRCAMYSEFGKIYNNYMALSHLHEMAGYVKQLDSVSDHVIAVREKELEPYAGYSWATPPSKLEAILPCLAQIHLAEASGMPSHKIDFMVNYMIKNPSIALEPERMDLMRESLLKGEPVLDILKYEHIIGALSEAKPQVSRDELNVLFQATDANTVKNLSKAFQYDSLKTDVASAIVDFTNKFNQQNANPEFSQAFPRWYQTHGKSDIFINLSKEVSITPDEIKNLGNSILEQGKPINFEEAISRLHGGKDVNIVSVAGWKPTDKSNLNATKSNNNIAKNTNLENKNIKIDKSNDDFCR